MSETRPLRVNFIPSIADLFFVTIFFLLFFFPKSRLLGDGDTGYHIRAGEYIIDTLSIPRQDIFSFHSPPLPWTAHEWLSEVIMALVHRVSGLTGIVAFFSLLLALTAYLLFRIMRSYQTDILLCTLVTALAIISSRIHWLARPHVFSFLLMIICHFLLESWHRDRQNRLYLLPPIMLLWVNLHGGFLGGFILLGAYLLGNSITMLSTPPAQRLLLTQKVKELGKIIIACLAVCLINPYGYRILLFPFRLVSETYIMDHVSEFMSPDFHKWMPFKYLLLLMIAIFAASRKRVEPTEVILILIFTNMSLYSGRYIPLFALITAPILTRKAAEARELIDERVVDFFRRRSENTARLDSRSTGCLWPLAALFIVAAATFSGRFPCSLDATTQPVAACEFLMKERIAGNMFNNDELGDHLIYRSYPSYKVFFDGRSDMYGADFLREYKKVVGFEKGWENILEKYRITWIFYNSQEPFSRFLLRDKNWVLIYSDEVANIFVKDLPQYRELIAKYGSVKPVVVERP